MAIYLSGPSGSVTANVSAAFVSSAQDACSTRQIGNCTLTRCGAITEEQAVDAGKVTLNDGTSTIELTEAWQTDNGILTSKTPITYSGSFTLPWTGGETLTVDVAGSKKIPALHTSLRVPFATTVEAQTLEQRPSGPLRATWSPSVDGTVQVYIGSNADDWSAECFFDGSTGSAEVPAGVVDALDWSKPHGLSGRGESRGIASDSGARLVVQAVWQ